jgi:glycopeptide antibiotics resistance protein
MSFLFLFFFECRQMLYSIGLSKYVRFRAMGMHD